jgi:dTDP-4-dehydrorhamnose reductase
MPAPELWGGVECTIARLGDRTRRQLDETGHLERGTSDIRAIAGLNLRTVRYPALWEMIHPAEGVWHWEWQDRQMEALREADVEVVLGLVHHGSGPSHTSLLDPGFAAGLAEFAARVAERYPWVTHFTPVNEPMTTARFSCLYGHWYPHMRDDAGFLRAVFHQADATAQAMRAIRETTPAARLIVTEDVGRTFGSPALADQIDHDNSRRWLGWDLLTGRVDRHHAWHGRLVAAGVTADGLERLRHDPDARPDVLGLNYYLTSDRYLDADCRPYPSWTHGGNGRVDYADVEAIRVLGLDPQAGLGSRLRETWDRYGLLLAITEVHNGSDCDQQVAWLLEAWACAQDLAREGIDILAVTSWALFGSRDWSSLLTETRGDYEPGSFDIRGDRPRLTDLGRVVRDLAGGGGAAPYSSTCGWWRRSDRYFAAPAGEAEPQLA